MSLRIATNNWYDTSPSTGSNTNTHIVVWVVRVKCKLQGDKQIGDYGGCYDGTSSCKIDQK